MKCKNGFTLIEIIGVLAILSILASALLPNMISEIRKAKSAAEDKTLQSISNALQSSIIETHSIPHANTANPNSWNRAVLPYLAFPASKILTTPSGGNRRIVIRFTNGLNGWNNTTEYNQLASYTANATPTGLLPVVLPATAFILLVSNTRGLIGNITNDLQFDNAWNQTAPIPNGFTESDYVRISRINLITLFYRVDIACTSITGIPQWSIDNSATRKNVPIGGFTVYLLKGTRVSLFTSASIPNPVATVIVHSNYGLSYNGTAWGGF